MTIIARAINPAWVALANFLNYEKRNRMRNAAPKCSHQVEEIELAHLKTGEDEELRKERDRLANAESLAQNAQEALAVLDEGSPETPAATDLIGQAAQALAALAKIDPEQAELANQAELMLDTISDVVHGLQNYLEEIEFNLKRLDEVEERVLTWIHSLATRANMAGNIPAVLSYGADARKQLETPNGRGGTD
ncbi:MAG: hypothetical protein IPO36_18635 [Anaerolineales bacterium]|nr:hypothetical protein [Anaerolineales bacterium]